MSVKGTVLIFAYECYPHNRDGSAIGAQRPYQFAKNLSLLGWKVIVLCCDRQQRRMLESQEQEQSVEEHYRKHLPALKNDLYTIVPLPSLKAHGWGDYVWINTVQTGPGDTYIGKPFPHSLVRRISTFCNQLLQGDYSWSWTPVARTFADRVIRDFKVDIVLGEHGPDAGIILADQVSRAYGIPWIADFRDPVLQPFKGIFKSIYGRVVRKIIGSAAATVNVNDYWTSLDRSHFGKEAYTIVNGYDHVLFDQVQAHVFPAFTVSYFGSLKEDSQDVIPSLDAFAALLRKYNYPSDMLLFYRGFSHEKFLEYGRKAGIPEEHLDVAGFVERNKSIAYMKGSAVLLIYSFAPRKVKSIYERKGFYPGKLFEYIGAGVPVLLIPSDHGLLDALITEQNKGLACSTVAEAVIFLEGKYRQWQACRNTGLTSHNDIELYSRYAQAKRLDQILTEHAGLGKV